MLYLIGLGLDESGLSGEAYQAIEKCEKVYLENYTIELPYDKKVLEKNIKKNVQLVDREFVENLKFVSEAKDKNVALLVYGSPLSATTHITIIQEAIEKKIKYKIIYGASIIDAVAETGLQLYKFGKTASMPKWDEKKKFKPISFLEVLEQNQSIEAHTLILVDIGLKFKDALKELQEAGKNKDITFDKIVVCSKLGTDEKKIKYNTIEKLKKENIKEPYCFIIPGKMHFLEQDMINSYD